MPDPDVMLVGPAAVDYDVVPAQAGRRRLRRVGRGGGQKKTAAARNAQATANARLILHRTAVLVDGDDGPDLDDSAVRTWAVETNLGQGPRAGTPPPDSTPAPAVTLLAAVAARRRAALTALAAGAGLKLRTVELEPEAALLTGAGTGGVRDVGIELHGTYGWPVLSGSTLKGVTLAFTRESEAAPDIVGTPAERVAMFGAVTPDGRSTPGQVTFFDALPGAHGVRVAEHVLTPHTRGYRDADPGRPGEVGPPGEHINPVPVPFLAVEQGRFVVHLVGVGNLVDRAHDLLLAAVQHLGVGAKTSAGYGYLAAAGDAPPDHTTASPPAAASATAPAAKGGKRR